MANRPMPTQAARPNMAQLLQQLQSLQQNPMGFLRNMGLNVPQNLNNPNEIIQYLMNSGRFSQQQYEQARQLAAQLKKNQAPY